MPENAGQYGSEVHFDAMPDHIARFVSDCERLALSIVRAPDTCQLIGHDQHNLEGKPLRVLSNSILSSLLLATRLKGRGMLTWTLDTDGVFDYCRIDAIGLGSARALVRRQTSKNLSDWNGFDSLLTSGRLTISKQVESGKPYQTIMEVVDDHIAAITNHYLKVSEQIAAGVILDSIVENGRVSRATGLYIECLPGHEDGQLPDMARDIIQAKDLTYDCVIDDDQELADDLFGAGTFRQLHNYDVGFHCPCSKERYINTLSGFSAEEKTSLSNGDGVIVTTCDFCGAQYHILLDEIL